MEELVWILIVGLFKGIAWILTAVFRALGRVLKLLFGGAKIARRADPARMAPPRSAPSSPAASKVLASSDARARPAGVVAQLSTELGDLGTEAESLATRCRTEAQNLRFVPTLDAVGKRARTLQQRLHATGDPVRISDAQAATDRLGVLLEVVSLMAAQRRDPVLNDLLGDADALAESCYGPIVEHCRKNDIALASDRTATAIDGDKLFLLSVDDPAGLAAIVLPGAWASDLGWWPALAHEIGHDFYLSVPGLGAELTTVLSLPRETRLPSGRGRLNTGDVDRAVFAWHEELFADAFGTMMLGPAYLYTMAGIFARPKEPVQAVAVAQIQGRFEEHPPGHIRVACAARLLGLMGYGAEGDRLEARWRKLHADPDRV